jgi:hypothetical protein
MSERTYHFIVRLSRPDEPDAALYGCDDCGAVVEITDFDRHDRCHAAGDGGGPTVADAVKVTVTDPETGEVLGEQLLDNDYMVLCAGNRYVAHTTAHANGTHVLTVKVDSAGNGSSPTPEADQ